MRWEEVRGSRVKNQLGEPFGGLADVRATGDGLDYLYLRRRGVTPLLLRRTVTIPSGSATWKQGTITIDEGALTENLEAAEGSTRVSRLRNSSVFAGVGWKVGRLAALDLDPSNWRISRINVDSYPEYTLSSTSRSSRIAVYPPVTSVWVPAEGVSFSTEEVIGRKHNVILPIGGQVLEEKLARLLEGADPDADLPGLIQRAYDEAYSAVGG